MKQVSINKKKVAGHMYFGIQKDTGEILSIAAAERGLACNCKCAQCGSDLEARKGTKRRHHFAHVSNFDCLYANEIAVYMRAEKLLRGKELMLPEVPLKFYSRTEIVAPSKSILVKNIELTINNKAYPPILLVESKGAKLRIVFNFGNYYDSKSIVSLAGESEGWGWSSLLINLPDVDDEVYLSEKFLSEKILDSAEGKQWIYSRLAEQWRKRYLDKAVEPEGHGGGYICPIHVGKYKGKYSARWVDCMYCEYNVSDSMVCLCTAESGIVHVRDFSRPESELMEEVSQKRKRNDARIASEEIRQVNQKKNQEAAVNRFFQRQSMKKTAVHEIRQEPVDEQEIRILLEKTTDEPVRINGVRWLLCECCGRVCTDKEMTRYGGRASVNIGMCRECSRKEN